jgi:murein DD-endopeptidase MepM/ murein hydrolase activator NlpD
MAEQNQSGLSEVVEKSSGAANAIQGAIKTGKAISAISKGAAAAGPYGAIAGAVWANRKHLKIIIFCAVMIFLLPVLFILMLPMLIFGLVGSFFSGGGDPLDEIPVMIMNDTAAIIENIETVGSSLNIILLESLDDLYARIEKDYADSSGDRMEIINPYEGSNIINANLIISQYCAANEKDIDKITLADLEKTIRQHKGALFDYAKETETSTYTVTDPDTEEETEITETVIYYTVIYNGSTHFADAVFFLTDEQKSLAEDYNSNLHLFLNDNLIITSSNTHTYLAQKSLDNEYSGDTEDFGSPFAANWQAAVTSEFGYRIDPITGKPNAGHFGIDIGFPLGTEIKAVMSGKVIYVKYPTTGYGYHLAINHGNGIVTLYAHCSRIIVNEGDIVKQGEVIAYVGSTGRSTGPHLHFEVVVSGIPKNPREYLPT